MSNTTYTMTTVEIHDGHLNHCHTEIFNIDGKDHDILTVFNIIMSQRFDEIIVLTSDELSVSDNTIVQDCDEVQHILQRMM